VRFKDKSQGSQWAVAITAEEEVSVRQRNMSKDKVPNVTGMPLNDAVFLLENFKLRVKVEGHGEVVSQSPKAGTELIKGTQIKLVLR
jgi:cell division protein FtsI (penicillin-binding protein 3)